MNWWNAHQNYFDFVRISNYSIRSYLLVDVFVFLCHGLSYTWIPYLFCTKRKKALNVYRYQSFWVLDCITSLIYRYLTFLVCFNIKERFFKSIWFSVLCFCNPILTVSLWLSVKKVLCLRWLNKGKLKSSVCLRHFFYTFWKYLLSNKTWSKYNLRISSQNLLLQSIWIFIWYIGASVQNRGFWSVRILKFNSAKD